MSKKEMMLSVSCIEDIEFSSTVSTSTSTFPEVVAWLAEGGHIVSDDKICVPACNFSRYEGTRRKKQLIVDVSAAVLDLDDLSEAQVVTIREKISHVKSLCHTTYTHTASKPKLRLIVPFNSPVSPMRYPDYVRRLAQMLDVQYDRVSENPNTVYFLPSRPDTPSEDHFIESHLAPDFLDFDALPEAKSRASVNASPDGDSDERNYYDLAAEAQASMYPDGLVFVNGEFYEYADGVWVQLPVLSMKRALSRKDSPLHDVLASPAAMNNLIEGLKAHAHLDAFPEPAPMTVCVLNGVVGFSFKPYARIVATGNTLPELSDTSDGFSRRLAILTFNRQFAEHERDHDLQRKLLAELPGIFVWALEGLRRLLEAGKFTRVPSSTAAVAAYKLRSNPVAQFMTTMADKSTGRHQRTKSSDLYKAFHTFCQDNGFVPVMSNARFGIELSRMDIKSSKSNGSLYYPVKLRPTELATGPTRSSTIEDEMGAYEDEAA